MRLLFLALLPAALAQQPPDLWTAENRTLAIAVNKSRGTVQRLTDRLSGEDYCNQTVSGAVPGRDFPGGARIVGLSVFDELTGREFADLRHRAAVSAVETHPDRITFEKRFPGAGFVIRETYPVHADHIRWDVRVRKSGGRDRTLRVIQLAPLALGSYRGWALIANAPFELKPYRPCAIEYGQSTGGSVGERRWRTLIPMVVFCQERGPGGSATGDEPAVPLAPAPIFIGTRAATSVSSGGFAWRNLRRVSGFDRDLRVIARLPDPDRYAHVYAYSLDEDRTWKLGPERQGDTFTLLVPQHGRATVILLAAKPDPDLERASSRN